MVRKRPEAADESIILDIVNMDAEYDSELLPNKGIGTIFPFYVRLLVIY
jgi:hypothetical protein